MASSEDIQGQLAAMGRALAVLQAKVDSLESELRTAPARRFGTMRVDTCCPACGGRRILHALEVLDRGESGRYAMAIVQPSVWRSRVLGEFELYACTACGACEWWVRGADAIEPDGERFEIREVKEPEGSGYR